MYRKQIREPVKRPLGPRRSGRSGRDAAAELVLDVGPDDLLERGLGREAELAGAPRVEVARPALDDADHERIGLAPDARRDLVARDPAQRLDLLADRDRDARHRDV